jgi:Flp pilus assembly protein TadD
MSENLALARLGQRDLESAVQMATDAVRKCPDDWHAHYALGQCFRFSGNLSAAIDALAKSHQMAPHEPPVLLALSIARQLSGGYDEAINAFQEA